MNASNKDDLPVYNISYNEDDVSAINITQKFTLLSGAVSWDYQHLIWIIILSIVGCLLLLCYTIHWLQITLFLMESRERKCTRQTQTDYVNIRALERNEIS